MPGDATFDVGRIEAEMTLDTAPFQAGLDNAVRRAADTQAEIDRLLDFGAHVDTAGADADLAALKTAASGIHLTVPVWADTAPFWADLTVLRAEVAGLPPLTLRVAVDTDAALADLAALESLSSLAAGSGGGGTAGTIPIPIGGADSGGGDAAAAAALAAAAGGSGKGGGRGLLSSLLWGGGGLFGLAGVGSLASFAGFGPEHLLMTGVGLAGSAVGAGLGGALLGAGSLGVMGVGMGTDMAGIGQALGDTKSVVQAQNALTTAISNYGAASTQAAAAQANLNTVLGSFSPLAKTAVVQAANTAQQFHQLFNAATGAAEATGANILTQVMQVGESFLPTIGRFADQNMHIIQASLQPLFAWLQGPGLTIFTELETKFQSDLPTAMHAFDQGVELVMRTLGLVAPQTGGLIKLIDQLVTRFNGAGWGQWSAGVEKLIGDFRMWEGLVKILAADIYQLFSHDAGTASGIVAALTAMLTKLHEWETSVAGGAQLHTVFETHKQEVLALLALLPPLITTFGHIYLTVGPELTQLATLLLKVTLAVTNFLTHLGGGVGVFTSWVIGVSLLLAKLGLLTKALAGVRAAFGLIAGGAGAAGVAGAAAGGEAAAGEAAAGGAAAEKTGLLSGAMGALVAAGPVVDGVLAGVAASLAFYTVDTTMAADAQKRFNAQINAVTSGEILDNASSYDAVSNSLQNLAAVQQKTADSFHLNPFVTSDAMIGFQAFEAAATLAAQKSQAISTSLMFLSAQSGRTQTALAGIARAAGVDLSEPLSKTAGEMSVLEMFAGDSAAQLSLLGKSFVDLHGPAATAATQLQGINELFAAQNLAINYTQAVDGTSTSLTNLGTVTKSTTSTVIDIRTATEGAIAALDQQIASAQAAGTPLDTLNQMYETGYEHIVSLATGTTGAKNATQDLVKNLITPAQFDAQNTGFDKATGHVQGYTQALDAAANALRNYITQGDQLAGLLANGLGVPGIPGTAFKANAPVPGLPQPFAAPRIAYASDDTTQAAVQQLQRMPHLVNLLTSIDGTLKAQLPQVGARVAGALNANASTAYVQARGARP